MWQLLLCQSAIRDEEAVWAHGGYGGGSEDENKGCEEEYQSQQGLVANEGGHEEQGQQGPGVNAGGGGSNGKHVR